MSEKIVPTHFLANGDQIIMSGYLNTITREVTFSSDATNGPFATSLHGARLDMGDNAPSLFVSQTATGFVADTAEVFAAKKLVKDNRFEVVKDEDSDYFRWRAINYVEESGLFDTDDEAYLGCVSQNGLDQA
ncbi:hypothetical protein RYA05_03765 [Pseudomonas syringae pv. actinidiae]|nr:hypothetical protein [Pseudomonas syringae pv. actinidiae]